jgi:thiamine biosynthesis lipoprotein
MHRIQTAKPISRLIAGGLFAILLILTQTSCQRPHQSQQRFLQFGTLIDVTLITTSEKQADKLFAQIEQLLITRHSEWHGWLDGTLMQFNKSMAGQPETGTPIPPTLKQLILDSKKYYELTSGLFNPAMGRLIAAWGFHQNANPDTVSIDRIKKDIPGMHDLVLDNDVAFSMNTDLQLDFGAIAKGLAIQQIARIIQQHGVENFIINAGGDIYAHGHKNSKAWRVAIEHPFKPGIIGGVNMQSDSSIFTSGDYRRYYEDKDKPRRHHIINPLNGEPSRFISSATVMHADPVRADVAATTLMLTEISQLEAMARRLDIDDFIVITDQHEVYLTASMLSRIDWLEKDDFTLNVL